MISNVQEKTQNHFIQSLKESLATQQLDSAECLILIHQDDVLQERLSPVMQCLDSLVLQIPQGAWQFGESHLAAAISWAIREAGIRSIYVCGHSFVTSENSTPGTSKNPGAVEEDENANRLWMLGRLLDNQDRLQRAKSHFAHQIDQCSGSSIRVTGLRTSVACLVLPGPSGCVYVLQPKHSRISATDSRREPHVIETSFRDKQSNYS